MPACRFCPKYARDHEVVKYSTRHYAHFACYLDHKPLSDLKKWQIESFPFRLLKERGLMDEVERLTCEPIS
jgi:hypothetical protein